VRATRAQPCLVARCFALPCGRAHLLYGDVVWGVVGGAWQKWGSCGPSKPSPSAPPCPRPPLPSCACALRRTERRNSCRAGNFRVEPPRGGRGPCTSSSFGESRQRQAASSPCLPIAPLAVALCAAQAAARHARAARTQRAEARHGRGTGGAGWRGVCSGQEIVIAWGAWAHTAALHAGCKTPAGRSMLRAPCASRPI
jgi:hypothetical protein